MWKHFRGTTTVADDSRYMHVLCTCELWRIKGLREDLPPHLDLGVERGDPPMGDFSSEQAHRGRCKTKRAHSLHRAMLVTTSVDLRRID